MSFKSYLNEYHSLSIKMSSQELLSWIAVLGYLPVSPKFFEKVFGTKEIYCFQSLELNRVSSLINRQHKRNQVSTFTKWRSPDDIFWGATGMGWKNMYPDDLTAIAVLNGKYTIEGNTDIWTRYEAGGRRWIDVDALSKEKTEFSKLMEKIRKEVRLEFQKEYEKLDLKLFEIEFKKDSYLGVSIDIQAYDFDTDIKNSWTPFAREKREKYPELNKKDFNKEVHKVIKAFFDSSYKIFTKYKNELQAAGKESIETGKSGYNEVLCYDYKVEKLLIYFDESKSKGDLLKDYYENEMLALKRSKIPVQMVSSIKELEKELRKYQKKNKSQK